VRTTLLALSFLSAGWLSVDSATAQSLTGSCSILAASTPLLRAEGMAELVGDILLSCTGGTVTPAGTPLPMVGISILMSTTGITSRRYPSGRLEALLLVDDPTTQRACDDPYGVCQVISTGMADGNYDGSAGRPNIFPGLAVNNTLSFGNIPFAAPGPGKYRIFRITNVRVHAAGVASASPGDLVPVTAIVAAFCV